MKKKIKMWLREYLGIETPTIIQKEEPKKNLAFFLANRHYLGSINTTDGDEYLETCTESERREYETQASLIFNNSVFKREVKRLLALQANFIASESEDWEQTLMGRGTINGIGLFEDRFALLNSRHLENIKRPEENVDNSPL